MNCIKKFLINVINKVGFYINIYYVGFMYFCLFVFWLIYKCVKIYCLIFILFLLDCWGGILDIDYLFFVIRKDIYKL